MDKQQDLTLQDCIYSLSEWMMNEDGHVDNITLEIWYILKQLIEIEISLREGATIH